MHIVGSYYICDVAHSPLPTTKVKKARSFASTQPYALLSWWFTEHKDKITLIFLNLVWNFAILIDKLLSRFSTLLPEPRVEILFTRDKLRHDPDIKIAVLLFSLTAKACFILMRILNVYIKRSPFKSNNIEEPFWPLEAELQEALRSLLSHFQLPN